MTDAAAVQMFISKWELNKQKESAAAKEHFSDLCRLLVLKLERAAGVRGSIGGDREQR